VGFGKETNINYIYWCD